MYRIKSVQSDYVTARSWDGAADGSDDVLIAKEPRIRNSVASETIYGVAHTFTYSIGSDSLNKVRHHVSGPEAQDEILVPPWLSNEVVFAIESETGVLDGEGNKVPLLMLRSAQWAKF